MLDWSQCPAVERVPGKVSGDWLFKGTRVPSCIKPPMRPLVATGNNVPNEGRSSRIGLADGPLTVIDGLKIPKADRQKLLEQVCLPVQG